MEILMELAEEQMRLEEPGATHMEDVQIPDPPRGFQTTHGPIKPVTNILVKHYHLFKTI